MRKALSSIPGTSINWAWGHMPLIPALGKRRQEYQRFNVILGYTRLLSKQTNDSRVCFDGSPGTCCLPSRPSLGGADLRGQTPFLLAFEGLLIGSQLQSPLFFLLLPVCWLP